MEKKGKKTNKDNLVISKNNMAKFEFNIEKTLEVGVELRGWEVKSIRMYGVSLRNTFIQIRESECWWIESNIKDYIGEYKSKRNRKILIKRNQINKWYGEMTKKNLTIIPLECYFKNRRYFKINIGLCSRSSNFDKREKIKEREFKNHNLKELY